MRRTSTLLFTLILMYLGFIVYANRALFFSRFDEAYWKDRFEQSQWRLPMSVRTVGDDGLFLYEGFRLVHGDDPSNYNPEVPPLGKYLIGTSILMFGNGYWYGYIVTCAAIILFFILAHTLLKNLPLALAMTLVFSIDPLIANQFTLTMLDSLHLAILLLFFLALVRKKHAFAGAAFGCFAGVKFPLLAPVLLCISGLRRWQSIAWFLGSAAVVYLIPYLGYFLAGHTIVDWLHIQKGIVDFYTKSLLAPNTGSAIMTLLLNRYQNLFTHTWGPSAQWSFSWPIITFIGFYTFVQRKNISYIAWFLLGATLLYSIVPFWTRYLIVILPFLYLGTGKLLAAARKPIVSSLVCILLFSINTAASWPILFPTPEETIRQFTYDWSHGFFQDMYERISEASKIEMSREKFHRFGKTIFADGEIEWVTIDGATGESLTVTYHTRRLGDFTETVALPIVKENGQWRIAWDWNLLITGLSPERHLISKVQEAKRGTIQDQDGMVLAYDAPGVMVWVTPKNIDPTKEPELLPLLSSLFPNNIPGVRIHHRYVGNTLADTPIPIGVTSLDTKPIAAYSGISLTPAFARWYNLKSSIGVGQLKNTTYEECCSWLYTTTTYDGVGGIEATYNNTLKGTNGGTLVLTNADGQIVRELIRIDKQKNGNNVRLSY